MYENFKPFIDKWGLIAQNIASGADGGDSAHRFGIIFSCLKILGAKYWISNDRLLDEYYFYAMAHYEKSLNTYVRHPNPEMWYSNPMNFSRDQTTMIVKSMLVMGDKGRIQGVIGEIFKRFGFHKNEYPNYTKPGDADYKKKVPDIITPSEIGDWLRSFRSPLLYPLLCIIDSFKFIDIYLAEKDDDKSKAKGSRTDYFVMIATDVVVSRYVQDTFVLRAVARKLAKTDYKNTIKWIFRREYDDPPVDELLIPVCEKWIDSVR